MCALPCPASSVVPGRLHSHPEAHIVNASPTESSSQLHAVAFDNDCTEGHARVPDGSATFYIVYQTRQQEASRSAGLQCFLLCAEAGGSTCIHAGDH